MIKCIFIFSFIVHKNFFILLIIWFKVNWFLVIIELLNWSYMWKNCGFHKGRMFFLNREKARTFTGRKPEEKKFKNSGYPVKCPIFPIFNKWKKNPEEHDLKWKKFQQDDTSAPGMSHPMGVRGNVLNRVGHQQDKWKRQVREQRRNIYDRHTMLNWSLRECLEKKQIHFATKCFKILQRLSFISLLQVSSSLI